MAIHIDFAMGAREILIWRCIAAVSVARRWVVKQSGGQSRGTGYGFHHRRRRRRCHLWVAWGPCVRI